MYLGQDWWGPEEEAGPSATPEGTAIPDTSANSGASFDTAPIVSAIQQFFRGWSIAPRAPSGQGAPGTQGCGPTQCPTPQGPLVLCAPCGTPARPVTAQGWFWPVVVVGGLAVVVLARR